MANFTRVRADFASCSPGTALEPEELWQLIEQQAAAINGNGGGSWSPTSPIEVLGEHGIAVANLSASYVSSVVTQTNSCNTNELRSRSGDILYLYNRLGLRSYIEKTDVGGVREYVTHARITGGVVTMTFGREPEGNETFNGCSVLHLTFGATTGELTLRNVGCVSGDTLHVINSNLAGESYALSSFDVRNQGGILLASIPASSWADFCFFDGSWQLTRKGDL